MQYNINYLFTIKSLYLLKRFSRYRNVYTCILEYAVNVCKKYNYDSNMVIVILQSQYTKASLFVTWCVALLRFIHFSPFAVQIFANKFMVRARPQKEQKN